MSSLADLFRWILDLLTGHSSAREEPPAEPGPALDEDDVARHLARRLDRSSEETRRTLEELADLVADLGQSGRTITLSGLGTWSRSLEKPPEPVWTGEEITSYRPARFRPQFEPDAELTDRWSGQVGAIEESLTERDREVAELIVEQLPELDGASILFLEADRRYAFTENRPGGQGDRDEEPVTLRPPEDEGEYFLFFVDEAPTKKYAHPVRYGWANLAEGRVHAVEAQWPPVLTQRAARVPDQAVFTLDPVGISTISGIACTSCTPQSSSPPPPSQRNKNPIDLDNLRRKYVNQRSECMKLALVVDAGGSGKAADNMASDAKAIRKWVHSEGFDVTRISQYRHNYLPYFPGKSAANQLTSALDVLDDAMQLQNVPEDCCHELFLYLSAHGNPHGIGLYDPYAPANKNSDLDYDDLFAELDTLPDNVKATILIDACYSGSALADIPSDYCQNHSCGLTLLTVTGGSILAASGHGPRDSGTEDFNQGASEDHDGDNRKGDLFDRFWEMKQQGPDYKPQVWHCHQDASGNVQHEMTGGLDDPSDHNYDWCSLD